MRFLYENPIYICRNKTNQFVSKQTNKSMKVTKKQYKLLSLPNQIIFSAYSFFVLL